MIETALRALERTQQSAPGVFTLAQLKNAGMSAAGVCRAVRRGDVERVAHGVYQLPDMADDEMFNAQLRRSQMVYSHDTALYLHGLNDRDPLRYSVTVPTGYNTKRLTDDGFKVFSLKKELHGQDIEEVETGYGHKVRAYNLERTICDCLRSRGKLQSEIVFSGLKGYVRRSDRNLNALMKSAEKLGVAALLRTYLEVLL
jgi:predicted transcriptional regulator of viral defense system